MATARYRISSGLAGLYLPGSISPPLSFYTRRELAEAIREEMKFYDFPKRLFSAVGIRKLWSQIVRSGSSSAHFSIQHDGYEIAFHGLTEEEANEAEERE